MPSRPAALLILVALAGGACATDAPALSYSERGADTCLLCHRDETTHVFFDTAHGEPDDPASPFGHAQLQCEACHGPGGAHAGRVPRGEARPPIVAFKPSEPSTARNAPCLECHDSAVSTAWHDSTHRFEAIACNDCHRSHVSDDPVLDPKNANAVCGACHRRQRIAASKPYAHATEDALIQCSDCHAAHGGGNEFELVRETLNHTCYQCHAEKRGPFLWEHAPVVDDCSNCHDAHGSNHPAMLSRRAPFLCQSCHSQAGHPSVAQSSPDSGEPSAFLLLNNCQNCHSQVHGSNHPSGEKLTR